MANTDDLRDALQAYITATKNYIDRYVGKLVVAEYLTLDGETEQTYDLSSLVSDPDKYNLPASRIEVRVLDDETGSPTEGDYINSEAVITTGIRNETTAVLYNHQSGSLDCHVRIDVPVTMDGDGSGEEE